MSDPTLAASRPFWRSDKTDKNAAQKDVTFVQQDPSGSGKRGSRISRLFKRGSTSTTASESNEGNSPEDGRTSAQKRRQQVYQAQKRHRNRKADYIHSLEAEIAKLQSMDAQANVEKNALAHQNKAMRELLASKSLDFGMESLAVEGRKNDGLSSVGSVSIEVRPDPDLNGKDRTFLDFNDEMNWSTSGSATVSPPSVTIESPAGQQQPFNPPASAKPDSWAAVDFILALEFPCQDHLPHHGINPAAKPMLMETEDSEGFTGHQLTMTSWVYDAAQPGGHVHEHGHEHGKADGGGEKWTLPHAEIEKLIALSTNLPIDEEEITPAQAYSAVRNSVPSEGLLQPALDALKGPLSGIVECRGFGTVMPTQVFRQYLGAVLEGLGIKTS